MVNTNIPESLSSMWEDILESADAVITSAVQI